MTNAHRFFTVVSLLICFSTFLYGQEKADHEFTIGYGILSTNEMVKDVGNGISTLFSFGTTSIETKSTGALNLAYKYAVSQKFKIGAVLASEKLTDVIQGTFSSASEEVHHTYTTIAIESDIRYILKENFQMYSGIGIGYTVVSSGEYDQSNYMNFHLNAIGVRIGRVVALRLELGIGYKGVLNGGISVQI